MNKEDVLNFLDTASPEVFQELRDRMAQIRKDRLSAEHLEKKEVKNKKYKSIFEHHEKGMSFAEIGRLHDLSGCRCRQVVAKMKQRRGFYEYVFGIKKS